MDKNTELAIIIVSVLASLVIVATIVYLCYSVKKNRTAGDEAFTKWKSIYKGNLEDRQSTIRGSTVSDTYSSPSVSSSTNNSINQEDFIQGDHENIKMVNPMFNKELALENRVGSFTIGGKSDSPDVVRLNMLKRTSTTSASPFFTGANGVGTRRASAATSVLVQQPNNVTIKRSSTTGNPDSQETISLPSIFIPASSRPSIAANTSTKMPAKVILKGTNDDD